MHHKYIIYVHVVSVDGCMYDSEVVKHMYKEVHYTIAGCVAMYHEIMAEEHTDLIISPSLLLLMQYIFIFCILLTTSVFVVIF